MRSKIFRDREKLSAKFIPYFSPYRDHHLGRLKEIFTPILKGSRLPAQAVVVGGIGSGKTMTAKQLMRHLESLAGERGVPLLGVYVDCRKERTPGSVVRCLASLFSPQLPLRGFTVEETFFAALREAVKRELAILMVLDGADLILRNHQDMGHLLSRVSEVRPNRGAPSLLITLRSLSVFSEMDPSSVSGLRKNVIGLEDYDRDQLTTIVEHRVKGAFKRGSMSKESVRACVDLASEHGFNVKYALELLARAGDLAESAGSRAVSLDHIRSASREVSPLFAFDELGDLSVHEKLVLFSSAQALGSSKRPYLTMGELEETYGRSCVKHGVRPLKHTRLWSVVGTLSQLGFIQKRISGPGLRGRTTLIELPVESKKSLSRELSTLLKGELSRVF
ncbi:MAG: Cdc6/Cdc18 family protein [Candidatus Geothermarchaeales archaeon]